MAALSSSAAFAQSPGERRENNHYGEKARPNLQMATVNAALERRLITLECVPFEPVKTAKTLNGPRLDDQTRDESDCVSCRGSA
jgi:hypothetical protein